MSKQQNFKRYEKKYLINEEQYQAFRECLNGYMQVDQYDWSTICNIYYDTPDYRLIRTSIEKPVYKEKLRLRTYGVPSPDSPAFVEIKKKFKKIVYKRRVKMPYQQAFDWLGCNCESGDAGQVEEEIHWFCKYYGNLRPAIVLCYERLALYGNENKDLRVTFDKNIRWRIEDIDLLDGDEGTRILPEDHYVMEIKIPGSMPLWMSAMLDELKIYPTSFSKYGRAYQTFCDKKVYEGV